MGIVARQSIKASISNYLGVLIGFATLLYFYPLFFTPKQLGASRLLVEIGAVVSGFSLLGSTYAVNRFFPYFKNPPLHHGFFFWIFLIPALGYLLSASGILILEDDFIKLFKKDTSMISDILPMIVVLVLFMMLQSLFESVASNYGRITIPNFIREVVVRLFILVFAYLFYVKIISFTTFCWSLTGVYLIGAIATIFYVKQLTPISLKPDFKFLSDHPEVKTDAIKFTLWFFIVNAVGLIINKIDFLMISASKSLDDTAVYSIGFYLAVLIEIPKRTIMQISNPIFAEHMKNQNVSKVSSLYKQLSNNQLLVGSILFLLIWLNVDTAFHIMPNGEYYKAGKMVVFYIGIGKLFEMVGITTSPILSNSKFYAWGLITSLIMIFSAVGLNLWLIPLLGIDGAAIATVLTFIFGYGFVMLLIYVKMKIHPFTKNQIKTILLLALFIPLATYIKLAENPIADSFLKTPLMLALLIPCIYYWKISPEFNEQIQKAIHGIRQFRKNRTTR